MALEVVCVLRPQLLHRAPRSTHLAPVCIHTRRPQTCDTERCDTESNRSYTTTPLNQVQVTSLTFAFTSTGHHPVLCWRGMLLHTQPSARLQRPHACARSRVSGMYIFMHDYIAVSTRTLTHPTTRTDGTKIKNFSKARAGASRGHNPAVPPHVPSPPKATDGYPNQPPRQRDHQSPKPQ